MDDWVIEGLTHLYNYLYGSKKDQKENNSTSSK